MQPAVNNIYHYQFISASKINTVKPNTVIVVKQKYMPWKIGAVCEFHQNTREKEPGKHNNLSERDRSLKQSHSGTQKPFHWMSSILFDTVSDEFLKCPLSPLLSCHVQIASTVAVNTLKFNKITYIHILISSSFGGNKITSHLKVIVQYSATKFGE